MALHLSDYGYRAQHEIRQSLRRTVPPSSAPVSLDEVKRALDLGDDTGSDDELAELIPAAVDMVERDVQRALMTQKLQMTLDAFPGEIDVRFAQGISVTPVRYYELDCVI